MSKANPDDFLLNEHIKTLENGITLLDALLNENIALDKEIATLEETNQERKDIISSSPLPDTNEINNKLRVLEDEINSKTNEAIAELNVCIARENDRKKGIDFIQNKLNEEKDKLNNDISVLAVNADEAQNELEKWSDTSGVLLQKLELYEKKIDEDIENAKSFIAKSKQVLEQAKKQKKAFENLLEKIKNKSKGISNDKAKSR